MDEKIRFDGRETAEMPAGGGHDGDEVGFDGGLRMELLDVSLEDRVVFGAGFGVEDAFAGEQAVTEGVTRGSGFAPGSDGSARFGSIGSGGSARVRLCGVVG